MSVELYSKDTFVCKLKVFVITQPGFTWVPYKNTRVPGGYQDGYIVFFLEDQEIEINLKDPLLCVKYKGENYKVEIYKVAKIDNPNDSYNGKTEVMGRIQDY